MRSVRRLAHIPAAVGLLAVLVQASTAAGVPPRQPLPCPPRGQAVIAEDATMRMYRPKLTARTTSEHPVVACLIGSRTRMTLIPAPAPSVPHRISEPGSLRSVALAGDVAAMVVGHRAGIDTGYSEIVIVDVARRAILRKTTSGYSVDAGFVFSSGPTALDVTPEGAAAWIVQTAARGRRGPASAAVIAAARTGSLVTLDEGPGVEPESLYLSGDTVNWVDDGVTRSAPLPPAS